MVTLNDKRSWVRSRRIVGMAVADNTLRVYVTKKVDHRQLHRPVPKTTRLVDGTPVSTDVVSLDGSSSQYAILQPGDTVGPDDDDTISGVIACFGRNMNGNRFLISAGHVLKRCSGGSGFAHSPSIPKANSHERRRVGQYDDGNLLMDGRDTEPLDAGCCMIAMELQEMVEMQPRGVMPLRGIRQRPVESQELLHAYSAEQDATFTMRVAQPHHGYGFEKCSSSFRFPKGILARVRNDNPKRPKDGDSGTIALDSEGLAVGILSMTQHATGGLVVICPLEPVLSTLSLELELPRTISG